MTEDHIQPTIDKGDFDALAEQHGQELATARSAAKLSAQEVAQKLCITSATISLIESGRWAEAGPDVYVRGYVVGYGRLMEIDSSEAIIYFKQRQDERIANDSLMAQSLQKRPGLKQYRRFAGYAVASLLIGPALIFWVAQGFRGVEQPIDNSWAEVAGTVSPPALDEPVESAESELQAPIEERPVMASMSAIPDTLSMDRSPEAITSPDLTSQVLADEQDLVVEQQHAMLELYFEEDVWLEVSDLSGNRLGYGLMSASTDRRFSVEQGLKVRLGNATSVVARMDGETFDLAPYIDQDVADFVLPTTGEIDSESETVQD
jgi:cytoskeleton protein RodZ